MGTSFKGICHASKAEADIAFCQSLTFSGMQSNGDFMSQSCTSVDETAVIITRILGTTSSTQSVPLPSYLSCSHDGGASFALDYFVLGLGFLAVIFEAKRLQYLFTGRIDVA